MGCFCNTYCAANSYCTGYQAPCPANLSSWTALTQGVTEVGSSHMVELQSAINSERTHPTRRGVTPACGGNCSDSYSFTATPVNLETVNLNFNQVKDANNTTDYCTTIVYGDRAATDELTKADIDALRAGINGTEGNCICNSHCTCNTDCVCNTDCLADAY